MAKDEQIPKTHRGTEYKKWRMPMGAMTHMAVERNVGGDELGHRSFNPTRKRTTT